MEIYNSPRRDKRFLAIFPSGVMVHFGLKGGLTYIDHHDKQKREAYMKRHRPRENWDDPQTAGSLAKWLLWGDSTDLATNVRYFKDRFNV
jgi:hypothetical protein